MNIILCAGHHVKSKGAVNNKYSLNEYDEAIVVVEWLYDFLQDEGQTVTIVRGKLSDKVEQVNSLNPDLALDIHFNADYDSKDMNDEDDLRGLGSMVMYNPYNPYYGKDDPASYPRKEQAKNFCKAMSKSIGSRNLGARQGWYWGNNPPTKKDYFLSKTSCPAFIPEIGYIDNNKFCEDWLLSNNHQHLAKAIAEGINAAMR